MELKGYTNIPDWMLSLDLDVYETIILAVIYGFSQDGDSTFSGSQNYLARKAKCTKRKVAMALPNLVEKGLIIKIDRDVRGLHLCEYKVSPVFMGDECHSPGGDECHAHNNIENKNIDSIYKRGGRSPFQKPSLEEVAAYCRERGNNIDPEAFIAHYDSNGWMVGRNPMRDWRAAVRTWEKSEKSRGASTRSAGKPRESVLEHNLRVMDQMYGTDLHGQTYGRKEVVADEQ